MTPNKPRIQLWVDALRSGDFAQTKGRLARINSDGSESQCCLGVACIVAGAQRSVVRVPGKDADEPMYDGEGAVLPVEVREWYGLDENPTLIDEDGDDETAAVLNDAFDYSFERLADAIERTYLTEDAQRPAGVLIAGTP